MASLSFTLLPDALRRLHDVLICLGKFNESVSIEAEYDFLRFSTLNPTKSGYASFKFDSTAFFSEYSYTPRQAAQSSTTSTTAEKFSCQIYIKALLSVFKGRVNDFRDKDTAVERCVVQVFDGPDEAECRFVIQMICKHGQSVTVLQVFTPDLCVRRVIIAKGVVKTYRLTYESVEVQHALFDKSKTQNQWAVESKFLREIIDHFGPTAEQLDIHAENNRAMFTSFTQKVTNGKEILKQPVHTSVAIDTKDFDNFLVEEKLHVAISVKDFKAIVLHADTLKISIVARYTRPCRPLQLSYDIDGMTCEFTLMTRGEADEGAATSSNGDTRELTAGPSSRPPQSVSARHDMNPSARELEPNAAATTRPVQQQPSQPVVQESVAQTVHKQSAPTDPLFVPADDDRQWDEPNFANDDEDMLGWDAHTDQETLRMSLGGPIQDSVATATTGEGQGQTVIPPTQRVSQIRGLFD